MAMVREDHLFGAFWDPRDARFNTSALPAIATFAASLAVLVVSGLLLQRVSPYQRPQWLVPFIQEFDPTDKDFMDRPKWQTASSLHAAILAVASAIGLISQLMAAAWLHLSVYEWSIIISWFCAIGIIAVCRPRTASSPLLVIYASLAFYDVVVLTHVASPLVSVSARNGIICSLLAAVSAMSTLLAMPMRDPCLPSDDIASAKEKPSRDFRSPEDKLTLFEWLTFSWVRSLLAMGSSKKLEFNDIWTLAYEFRHALLFHQFRTLPGSVFRRLLTANGLDVLITTSLGLIELVSGFAEPVLLQQLLRAMEDPERPRRVAITYALLSMVAGLIVCQCDVAIIWFSRRAYERSRGEMITMLYQKTLCRKIMTGPPENAENENSQEDNEEEQELDISTLTQWLKSCRKTMAAAIRVMTCSRARPKQTTTTKPPASMGRILNLMRNDVYEVAQRFWDAHSLVYAPIGLMVSILLIWRLLGWSCLIGVAAIFVAEAINACLARLLLRWERQRRAASDARLHTSSQLVEAIRHLRWYGWQDTWKARVMEARQHELQLKITTNILGLLIRFTNSFASAMVPVIAFYTYTVWGGNQLRIDVVFPALQLFGYLQGYLRGVPDIIRVILNTAIALGRIEEFMQEPEKKESDQTQPAGHEVLMEDASFSWPGKQDLVLRNISLAFPVGLTVIYGKVAAGKTALLQALLGELDLKDGTYLPCVETIGYCSQTPWLASMSIRDNILFEIPYEPSRYKQVIEACALTPDLAMLKHGDLSEIGENSIGLSGGQKARVALARAVYSRASILLLDDPISALDHQTAESIVQNCFVGPLMQDRTVILATHRVQLCQEFAHQVVEVSEGSASIKDQDAINVVTSTSSEAGLTAKNQEGKPEAREAAAIPERFMDDEYRATGGVQRGVYWQYIKAGRIRSWLLLILGLTIYRLIDVGRTWFLKSWGEAYGADTRVSITGLFSTLPDPTDNVRPWLLAFFAIAAARTTWAIVCDVIMLIIVYCAGRQMFRDVLTRVCNATFRFYDVTPVGRLMNRFTGDIGTIDGDIAYVLSDSVFLIVQWIFAILVIASVTPVFLVFAIALTISYWVIFSKYLPASQGLRRLEMVYLSPLMTNFGALLHGLVTVRAFKAQSRFQDRNISVTDAFQGMDHFYWSVQAWLYYRFNTLSTVSVFILTLIALHTGVSPGLTAFALIAANNLVDSTHSLCLKYGQLQMEFVSVERVIELLLLEQESPGTVIPPAVWPSTKGDIVFEDVTIRYAPHMEPALSNVSFTIKGGTSTAIVGRTGSGKSTLVLALLATIPLETGRIIIDGIDTAAVSKSTLRQRVTFLAQEPLLFPGSLRSNLDPLTEHTDDECLSVITRVTGNRYAWTLSTTVETGGENLSQGQRQLVGLARAVLRRSAIVIMDEATASIDVGTAMEVQRILREEMSESTILTIAHRVEAVRGADFEIALDKGEVARAGPAAGRGGGNGEPSTSR